MKSEIKQKWLDALRSGKYKQSYGYLYNPNKEGIYPVGYCCFGVLCEVTNIEKDDKNEAYIFDGMKMYSRVPTGFCDLNQLDICDLMSMNDSRNHNFKSIANFIEVNIPVD